MMTPQPLFIPLYFDEAEADLWLALQGIEPEKRSSFIKEILRQVLLGTNTKEVIRHSLHKLSEGIHEIYDDRDYDHEEIQSEVLQNESEEIMTFSLEDLFVQTHVPNPEEGSGILTDHEQAKSKTNSSTGFEYMMKHIIGIEEDEEVLKVLSQRANQK